MTQQEHLNRIRARCVELLEIAEKITVQHAPYAQAGWRATIAAIDDSVWQPAPEGCCHPDNPWGVENTALIQQIIASWPLELL